VAQRSEISNKCLDTIKDALKNKQISINSINEKTYAYAWLCSQQYQDKSTSRGALIEVVYEGIPIKGSYNETNFMSFKSNVCQQNVNLSTMRKEEYVLNEIVSEQAPRMLETCMHGGNFSLSKDIRKLNRNVFILDLTFNSAPGNKIEKLIFTNPQNLESVRTVRDLVPGPPRPVTLKKINPTQWSTISASGRDQLNQPHNILVEIPPDNIIDLELAELYRIYFNPEKFMLSHRGNAPYCDYKWDGTYNPEKLQIGRRGVRYQFGSKVTGSRTCTCPGCPPNESWDEDCKTSLTADLQIVDKEGTKIVQQSNHKMTTACQHGDGLKTELINHLTTFDRSILMIPSK